MKEKRKAQREKRKTVTEMACFTISSGHNGPITLSPASRRFFIYHLLLLLLLFGII